MRTVAEFFFLRIKARRKRRAEFSSISHALPDSGIMSRVTDGEASSRDWQVSATGYLLGSASGLALAQLTGSAAYIAIVVCVVAAALINATSRLRALPPSSIAVRLSCVAMLILSGVAVASTLFDIPATRPWALFLVVALTSAVALVPFNASRKVELVSVSLCTCLIVACIDANIRLLSMPLPWSLFGALGFLGLIVGCALSVAVWKGWAYIDRLTNLIIRSFSSQPKMALVGRTTALLGGIMVVVAVPIGVMVGGIAVGGQSLGFGIAVVCFGLALYLDRPGLVATAICVAGFTELFGGIVVIDSVPHIAIGLFLIALSACLYWHLFGQRVRFLLVKIVQEQNSSQTCDAPLAPMNDSTESLQFLAGSRPASMQSTHSGAFKY